MGGGGSCTKSRQTSTSHCPTKTISKILTRPFKYRFSEFFVFDYDSLPYIFSGSSWPGAIFPLVALDKVSLSIYYLFILVDVEMKEFAFVTDGTDFFFSL